MCWSGWRTQRPVEMFLQYLYTDLLPEDLDLEDAFAVLRVANYYGVYRLKALCEVWRPALQLATSRT